MRPINGVHAADAAQMVKLVDTPASGAGDRKVVEVRVFFWAPIQKKPSQWLGFFVFGIAKSSISNQQTASSLYLQSKAIGCLATYHYVFQILILVIIREITLSGKWKITTITCPDPSIPLLSSRRRREVDA